MSNKKRDLPNETFDDLDLKQFVIDHSMEIFGFETRLNYEDPEFGIDLVAVHDPTIGIELERSNAVHGYWNDKYYGDALHYGFQTLNMEYDRKGHFFQKRHRKYPEYPESVWNPMVDNPSWNKNLFLRLTFFDRQAIVVPNEMISGGNKMLVKYKKVKNNKSGIPEFWASWRYENTKTFNMINGKMIRETSDVATHLPAISDEERKRLEIKRDQIKAEKKKKQEKEKERKKALMRRLNMVERREIAKMTVPMFESTLNKSKLDKYEIPQYVFEKEEYFKKHPILK